MIDCISWITRGWWLKKLKYLLKRMLIRKKVDPTDVRNVFIFGFVRPSRDQINYFLIIVGYIAVMLSAKAIPIKATVKLQQIRSNFRIFEKYRTVSGFFSRFFCVCFWTLGPKNLTARGRKTKKNTTMALFKVLQVLGVWLGFTIYHRTPSCVVGVSAPSVWLGQFPYYVA